MIRVVALAGAILLVGSALFSLGRVSVVTSSPTLAPFIDRDPFATDELVPELLLPTLHGIATHFDAERHGTTAWYTRAGIKFYGAAGPALRQEKAHEWRNRYRVIVSSKVTGRAVVVWIVDYCECRGGDKKPGNDRLVDLAPAIWDALGVPLSRGVTPVTVEILP
jgi:hypothetical protein